MRLSDVVGDSRRIGWFRKRVASIGGGGAFFLVDITSGVRGSRDSEAGVVRVREGASSERVLSGSWPVWQDMSVNSHWNTGVSPRDSESEASK
jgi:hypothetical protein